MDYQNNVLPNVMIYFKIKYNSTQNDIYIQNLYISLFTQETCPICGQNFPKEDIQYHASFCGDGY